MQVLLIRGALIDGAPTPAGAVVDVSDRFAAELVASGKATRDLPASKDQPAEPALDLGSAGSKRRGKAASNA